MNIWLQNISGEIKASFNQFLAAFEDAILMFNADNIIVTDGSEGSKEL